MSGDRQQIFVFDEFRLETADRQLLRNDRPIQLPPRAFDLLLALVKSGGHLIKKDELYSSVWAGQLVEDSNLTVQMSAIRRALGESKVKPHYITTVKGYGYRFTADVRELNGDGTISPFESETSRLTGEHEEIKKRQDDAVALSSGRANKKRVAAVLGSATALAMLIGLAAYVWQEMLPAKDHDSAPLLFQPASLKRLTTSGNAVYAALSPDGKLFVYSLNEKGLYSLWLGHADGGETIRLRPPAEVFYSSMSFAPDGSSFYYVQSEVRDFQGSLYRSPVLGGLPEKLRENVPNWIAIAPDSKRFAFVRNDEQNQISSIIIAELAGGAAERELISRPVEQAFTSGSLSWSPDGSLIAASAVGDDEEGAEIFTITPNGSIKQLTTTDWKDVRATTWLSNGSGLIFIAQEKNSFEGRSLWQISADGGVARRLNPDFHHYGATLSLSADNSSLLVLQVQSMPNVWVAPADDLSRAKQITFGSRRDGFVNVDWTPDGSLIYGSTLENSVTIWTMDADGGDQKQLTSAGYIDEQASVTADGSTIVFQSNRSGSAEIWRRNIDGGDLRQITVGGNNTEPHVAPDGKWVVFKGRDNSLWRIPLGGGDAVRLTDISAGWPRISPDNRFIACEYAADGKTKLAVFPIEGGEPVKLFNAPKSANFRYGIRWTPDGNAITYRDWFNGLWKQPFGGGEPTRLQGLPEEKLFGYAWSRDGKQFAFVRGSGIRDLVLFRR